MKQKLRNIRGKAQALWWLLTYKRYHLIVYNGRQQARELGNLKPSTIAWFIQCVHGMMTTKDLIKELSGIAAMAVNDKMVYNEIKQLIKKLEKQQ